MALSNRSLVDREYEKARVVHIRAWTENLTNLGEKIKYFGITLLRQVNHRKYGQNFDVERYEKIVVQM